MKEGKYKFIFIFSIANAKYNMQFIKLSAPICSRNDHKSKKREDSYLYEN